jgi:hypothetical protein
MEKIIVLQQQLESIGNWIRSADTKTSIILALNSVIFVHLLSLGDRILSIGDGCWYLVGALLIMLPFFTSLFFAFKTILPKIKAKSDHGLWFFGSIASMKKCDFTENLSNATNDQIEVNLIEQIYINSTIASEKHINLRKSWFWLVVFSVFAIASALLVEFHIALF